MLINIFHRSTTSFPALSGLISVSISLLTIGKEVRGPRTQKVIPLFSYSAGIQHPCGNAGM